MPRLLALLLLLSSTAVHAGGGPDDPFDPDGRYGVMRFDYEQRQARRMKAPPSRPNDIASQTASPASPPATVSAEGLANEEREAGYNPYWNQLKNPTPAQTQCRNNAPSRPGRVVFGFSGLGSYLISKSMIRGMVGKAENVDFHYHPWNSVDANHLTDVARCAFELATKPYKNSKGKTVYNRIAIVGHSFGGGAAYKLAKILQKMGIGVDVVVTADARESSNPFGGNAPTWGKPGNVKRWLNFYETGDFLRGYEIGGAENFHIGGIHISAPLNSELRFHGGRAMSNLAECRTGYTAFEKGAECDMPETGRARYVESAQATEAIREGI